MEEQLIEPGELEERGEGGGGGCMDRRRGGEEEEEEDDDDDRRAWQQEEEEGVDGPKQVEDAEKDYRLQRQCV